MSTHHPPDPPLPLSVPLESSSSYRRCIHQRVENVSKDTVDKLNSRLVMFRRFFQLMNEQATEQFAEEMARRSLIEVPPELLAEQKVDMEELDQDFQIQMETVRLGALTNELRDIEIRPHDGRILPKDFRLREDIVLFNR